MPLTLQAVLDPAAVVAGQPSTLTVTRSGGGESETVVYSESWDNDLSGWVPGGYAAFQTTSLPRSGAGCVYIQGDENNGSTLTFSRNETNPGVMKFWYYRVSGSTTNYDFGLKINGTTVWNVTSPPSVYTEYSVDIPAGANTYQFYIAGPGGSRSSNNRIDDLTISSITDTSTDALTIDLTSTDTDVATVPATLTIAQGASFGTATVTGVDEGSADITASYEALSDSATITVTGPPSYITHNGVVVLTIDPAFERISHVGANVLFAEPSYDRIAASQIVVVFNDIRYLLSDLLPLTLQPGERVTLKVLAINNFKGPLPATIEIFSNARNHPSFKFRIDSNGT